MKITIAATEYLPPKCQESVTYNYQMDLAEFRSLSDAVIGPAKEIAEALAILAKLDAAIRTIPLDDKQKLAVHPLTLSLDAKLREQLKPRLSPLREIIQRVVEKAEDEVRTKMEARRPL